MVTSGTWTANVPAHDLVVLTLTEGDSSAAPATPGDFSATGGDQTITLSWQDVFGAGAYEIYYSIGEGVEPTCKLQQDAPASPALFTGVANDQLYNFKIRAKNSNGSSEFSEVVSVYPEIERPAVYIDPDPAVAGQNVRVVYGGTLKTEASVYLHWGRNNWESCSGCVLHDLMTRNAQGDWEITITVPATAYQIDMAFANGTTQSATKWDNNGGADWHFEVVTALP